jgi:sterol desaturase/sphingolipid hydroxylase (fatty acid hydroxylase superfamily)
MTILLTGISAFLYSSLVEYCLHRFVQHSSYEMEHIKNHHRIFHGLKSYEIKDAKSEDILLNAKGILLNCALYLLPATAIFMQNKTFGILFLAVCFLYNLWEEYVHLYSHKSANMFFEQLEVFKKLKEHHRVHHYIYNSNFGIGTTLWDVVFRTKKLADRGREARMGKLD